MRSFEYYTPTRVIFGKDKHLMAGSILKEYGCHKVLIHYGSHGSLTVEYKKKCLQALWYLLFLCQIFCFIL